MSAVIDRSRVLVSARLVDAMRVLEGSNAQIALVTDEAGRLVGTLTDGDIRRALLGGATLDSPLAPHAQRQFVVVGPEAGRAEVLELMQARLIHQVPVLDGDGRLVGLHLLHELLGTGERPNWAVIMAGGKGLRLRPLTDTLPKPMLKVAGKPILERIVLHLVGFGVRRVFLAVNYLAPVIERHFEDGARFGCRIEYLRESTPLGTGGALSLLPEAPREPILVLNGDLVTQFDLAEMLAFHGAGGYKATVGVHEYTHTVPFGVLEVEGPRVRSMQEKPTASWRTNSGIYVLDPDLPARVPPGKPFPMPALIEECLERGEPVGGYSIEGDWIDVGRGGELRRARGHEDKP